MTNYILSKALTDPELKISWLIKINKLRQSHKSLQAQLHCFMIPRCDHEKA